MFIRPDLSDDEVDAICAGLKQHLAKVRYLQRLGLRVDRRPNGRPLIARAEWDRKFGGAQADPGAAGSAATAGNGPKWRVVTAA